MQIIAEDVKLSKKLQKMEKVTIQLPVQLNGIRISVISFLIMLIHV